MALFRHASPTMFAIMRFKLNALLIAIESYLQKYLTDFNLNTYMGELII